jgi:hypothetical protein
MKVATMAITAEKRLAIPVFVTMHIESTRFLPVLARGNHHTGARLPYIPYFSAFSTGAAAVSSSVPPTEKQTS